MFALEPRTGRVLVSASWPSFDPNRAVQGSLPATGSALVNRATQGLYPPGSSIKPVIAALALESGRYTPTSTFNDPGYFVEYGRKIYNDSGEVFGSTNADRRPHALDQQRLRAASATPSATGGRAARADGRTPAARLLLDPAARLSDRPARGLGHRAPRARVTLASPNAPIDPARTAIGQANLVATPMQMAMVAGAFANGGVVMRPTLVDRVRSPSGALRYQRHSEPLDARASAPQTAAEVTEMMKHVVDEGTGRAAQIPGVQIAGKTGTAQTGVNGQLDAWFIAFAPAEDPQVAVAVVVERTKQYGGQAAAPIARDVMQAVLDAGFVKRRSALRGKCGMARGRARSSAVEE